MGFEPRTPDRRIRLCYVVATPMTIEAFLVPHIRMALAYFDVSLVANAPPSERSMAGCQGARFEQIAIERKIHPLRDGLALLQLVRLFRRERFDCVHSISPKAGLLAMLAARIAGVPHRFHTFTGQVWVTRDGLGRVVLRMLDRLIAELTTFALADSPSQRDFLVEQGVCRSDRIRVIGKGSICGVDSDRFRRDDARRAATRAALEVEEGEFLVLFLGRLNRDKGVLDLALAFGQLAQGRRNVQLILAGPDEEGLSGRIQALARPGHCRCIGPTTTPELLMGAADVVCLPSYREGFGMVLVEAAASGVPAVASRIYGVTDAVVDGETGLLHEVGDVAGIATAIGRLHDDQVLRRAMGEAARTRTLAEFSEARVTAGLMAFYGKILQRQSDGT